MKEIDAKSFATEVKTGNVIVDFFGAGCGNCKMIENMLAQLEPEIKGVKFLKLNIDGVDSIVNEYAIASIPTLLFFKDGTMTEKLVGVKPKVILAKKIAEVFPS